MKDTLKIRNVKLWGGAGSVNFNQNVRPGEQVTMQLDAQDESNRVLLGAKRGILNPVTNKVVKVNRDAVTISDVPLDEFDRPEEVPLVGSRRLSGFLIEHTNVPYTRIPAVVVIEAE